MHINYALEFELCMIFYAVVQKQIGKQMKNTEPYLYLGYCVS